MTDITDILADREKTHGSYVEHAEISNVTYEFWASRRGFAKLTHDQRETLKMIAHKVGRALAGLAEFEDHWRDIAGYATLSADEVVKRAGVTLKNGASLPTVEDFFANYCAVENTISMERYLKGKPDATYQELCDYHDKLRHARPASE